MDFPYGRTPLSRVYAHSAYLDGLNDEGRANVLGVEAPLRTEYVPNLDKAYYMLLPRLAAVAENAWDIEKPSYSEFLAKLDSYYALLKRISVCPAGLKQAQPGKLRSVLSVAWFERRQLHWQGLHNLIDNAKVAKCAKAAAKATAKNEKPDHLTM